MNGQGGRQNRPSRHNPQTENRSQTQSAPGTIAGFGGCFLLVARIFTQILAGFGPFLPSKSPS